MGRPIFDIDDIDSDPVADIDDSGRINEATEAMGNRYMENVPVVQLYSPDTWHDQQAIVMSETGRTALINALLSGQHVLPAYCNDGEGYFLILITGSADEVEQYHKPYTWDIARDCSRSVKDPRLELTPAESDLAGQGKHMLIRAPEYKHVVKISLKKYLDWRFASVSDAEDAFDFIGSFVQHGWKGIQNEYKTLADINRTGHGILPDYLFAEGFEGAQRLCSERVSCVINPNCVEAVNIAIVWED